MATSSLTQQMRIWPTPTLDDVNGRTQDQAEEWQTPGTDSFRSRGGERKDEPGLDQQARLMWPTPHGNCHTGAGQQGRDGGLNIQTSVARQMWKTPHGFANTDRFGKTAGAGGEMAKQVTMWTSPRPTDENIDRRSPEAMERERDRPNAGASWPTPRAEDSECCGNHPNAQDSLTGVTREWPTPDTINRKSARAMTASTENGRRSGGGQSSPPGLEQVAEMMSGILPRELDSVEELPPATRALMKDETWATPARRDSKGGYPGGRMRNGKLSKDTLDVQIQALPSFHQGQETERPGPTSLSDGRGSPQLSMFPPAANDLPLFKENANGEWGTPTAQTGGDGDRPSGHRTLLCNQVWQTPKASNADCPVTHHPERDGGGQANLPQQIGEWGTPTAHERTQTPRQVDHGEQLANQVDNWPTPISGDAHLSSTEEAAQRRLDEGKTTLSRTVEANWTTPTIADSKNVPYQYNNHSKGADGISLTLTGQAQESRNGSAKRLNPTFVSWLMNYPLNWARVSMNFGPTETGWWLFRQRVHLLSLVGDWGYYDEYLRTVRAGEDRPSVHP
jgi:hypothetical protein